MVRSTTSVHPEPVEGLWFDRLTTNGRQPLRRGAALGVPVAAAVLAVVLFAPLLDDAHAHELGTPTNVTVTPLPGALKVSWNRVADGSRNSESPHYYVVRWRVKDPQSKWFGGRRAGSTPTPAYSVIHGFSGCTTDTDCSYTLSNSKIRADGYWRTYPEDFTTALLDPDKTYEVQVSAYGRYARAQGDNHYHEWSDSAEGSPLATDVTLSGLELWNATPGSDAPVDLVYALGDRLYSAVMLREVASILVKPNAASFFEVNISVKLGESGTPQTVRHGRFSTAIKIPPNADPSVPHEIYVTLTAVNDDTNTATYTLKVYQYPPASFDGVTVEDMTFTEGHEISFRGLSEAEMDALKLPQGSGRFYSGNVTYTATGLPPGLYMNYDRLIRGTPTAATTEAATVTYTVTDGIGASASLSFDVTVAPPVTFDADDLNTYYGRVITYTAGQAAPLTVTLPEATGGTGTLTYELVFRTAETVGPSVPGAGVHLDPSTRVLTIDGNSNDNRIALRDTGYAISYRARDENGATASASSSISVIGPPTLSDIDDQTYTAGSAVSLTLGAASGPWWKMVAPLSYELTPQVNGLVFSGGSNPTLSGTPTIAGVTEMTYTATDGNDVSATKTFTVTVVNGPDVPTAAPASLAAAQVTKRDAAATWEAVTGATGYVIQVIASDGSYPDRPVNSAPDGVALSFFPGGVSGVSIEGLDDGDYKVRVAARNDDGVGPWSEEASFTVKVGGI